MRDWKGRLPALIFAATLVMASPQALSGGRDVPDRKSEGSESGEVATPLGDWDCPGPALTRLNLGWLSLDVMTAADGTVSVQPSLVRKVGEFLRPLRPQVPGGGESCSTD